MPLIRYDTGDLAVSLDDSKDVMVLENLSGRSFDCIFSVDGKLVSSVAISTITEILYSINRYQIIQKNYNNYLFKYEGEISQSDFNILAKRLNMCLGENSKIIFEKCEKIANNSNGKYRTVINECKR